MEKICENCKHWDAGDCSMIHTPKSKEWVFNDKELIFAEWCCNGSVRTGPHFGCIHFEPKSSPVMAKYPGELNGGL